MLFTDIELPLYDPAEQTVFDVVVVGSGPSGLAVADRVAAAGFQVGACLGGTDVGLSLRQMSFIHGRGVCVGKACHELRSPSPCSRAYAVPRILPLSEQAAAAACVPSVQHSPQSFLAACTAGANSAPIFGALSWLPLPQAAPGPAAAPPPQTELLAPALPSRNHCIASARLRTRLSCRCSLWTPTRGLPG